MTGDREQAARQVRSLERQDANLRRAPRTASAAAAERISVEPEALATDLADTTRHAEAAAPVPITTKLAHKPIDQMTGLLDHAPLEDARRLGQGPVRTDRRRRGPAARRHPLEGGDRSGC